jgi:N-methylhydantoinase B
MIVRRFELATDSAGAGEFAGGPGINVEYEVTRDAFVTSVIERTVNQPWGLDGGTEGRAQALFLILPDGTKRRIAGKTTALRLAAGTKVLLETAGGGGYGDPHDRESAQIRRDLELGYISEEAARERYPAAELTATTAG